MKNQIRTLIILSIALLQAVPAGADNLSVEVWNCIEIPFYADRDYSHPLSEEEGCEVDVVFTDTRGTTLIRPAFWDGRNVFKVRFAPTHTGVWQYKTLCKENHQLAGISGSITAKPYTGDLVIYRHGFLKTSENKRYFTYHDGTPFFYLGDTHWSMPFESFDSSNIPGIASQFKYMVDTRIEQGFTVYQSEPIFGRGAKVSYSLESLDANDLPAFVELDKKFQYIAEKGMVHANAQLFFTDELASKKDRYPEDYLNKLTRYWVARYGAYPVMWTTAQEADNNFYYDRDLEACPTCQKVFDSENNPWKIVLKAVHQYDAYHHPLSAHMEYASLNQGTMATNSSFKTIEGHSWYACQWGHGRPQNRYTISFRVPKDFWNSELTKPAINYEGHYDHFDTNTFGARMQAWTSYLNGVYGFGYGAAGIWLTINHYPDDMAGNYGLDNDSDEEITKEVKRMPWNQSLFLPAAIQLGQYLRRFLESMEWWRLTPRFDDPVWSDLQEASYALSTIDSDLYVCYLYNNTLKTGTLKNLKAGTTYTAQWYDPQTGDCFFIDRFQSENGEWEIPAKRSEEDWVLIVNATAASFSESGKIKPVQLTCEYLSNPSVVDASSPRLSWINETVSDKVRGEYQQAYRICVASTQDKLLKNEADVWDSGKVSSRDSYLIPCSGNALQSGKEYWWRVMAWDSKDRPSAWSDPACWGMGLLSPGEWQAKWIGAPWQDETPRKLISALPADYFARPAQDGFPSNPAPLLRKSFRIKNDVASAKAFVTGLGFFELYLNGKKVSDDCLVPNFTNYTVREDVAYDQLPISIDNNFRGYRVMYLAYDITDMLQEQQNVAGAILGDGFYDCTSRWVASFGSPRFLCQIEIRYKDGTKDIVCSDATWKVKESPIVMNGIYDGEIYDANRETEGWATSAYDDSGWKNAVLREAPTGELTAHTAPTDKVVETLQPVSLTKNEDGTYEVDFGVEISGWIRFRDIQGKKGDTLEVKYICESPLGVQKYIFKGSGKESYAPRFTWYVFRKAIISGIDPLTPDRLVAEAVNTDVKTTAEFRTSNPLFDQIHTIWQRSLLDNLHGGIMSDCPHRERSPYTGDGQVACVTVMHNFDAAAFYKKWIRDMRDAQNVETGYVPNGAPWQPGCGGGVAWGAAMNIMPWEFYLHYGNIKMLEENYPAMKEQVRYLLTWLTKDGTVFSQKTNLNSNKPNYWLNLGDWAPAFQIPSEELVHTFYLWRCADFTARAAKALNRQDEWLYFSSIASDVKTAFHKKFYDAENKTYGDYGSNVFALVMGLPQERYEDVVNTWHHEIVEQYKGHLNTGIFGTQFFFETLAAHGMNDVAYEAMNKRDFPSYGHWIEQGATVSWEQWNGKDSRNHPMFGGGLNWFYRTLAGVNADENEPGYKHIVIKPQLPEKLDYVYYSNRTPYGKIVSEVKKSAGRLEMNVTIPVGSYATVHIPVSGNALVTESGRAIETVQGIEKIGEENGRLIVKAMQGCYQFVSFDAYPSLPEQEVDICVYGGTAAGVIAAYSAKKMGKSVILIEPGKYLGGLTTGGLGATDIGNKDAITGLSRDFYRRVGKHYGQSESWTFEPSVAAKILHQYVEEAQLEVMYQKQIVSATKEGTKISYITLEDAQSPQEVPEIRIRAKQFIDCSYEGDLMARAGVSYTIGRESNSQYNETWNGVYLPEYRSEASGYHQFPDGIDPYKIPGDPASGLLWGISSDTLQANGTGDHKLQAYNFRICLTNDPENRIPISLPGNYDPQRYELLVRLFEAQPEDWPVKEYFIWSQMPGNKTDVNNRGAFSTDRIGVNYSYPEASYDERKQIFKEHEEYTKGLLYFYSTDPRVPKPLQDFIAQWGYPKDEYPDNKHWTPQLYIREARRMMGSYVMTEANCIGKEVVTDGIGMAAYTMDSHNCQRIVIHKDGKDMVKNEGNVEIGGFKPYPVSYRALLPKENECVNLLVPVCLSASHIAFGSIRMEPVFMVLGQSAAIAACLAIDNNTSLHAVDVEHLKEICNFVYK